MTRSCCHRFCTALLVSLLTGLVGFAEPRLRIEAGEQDRDEAPVIFTVPAEMAKADRLMLVSGEKGAPPRPVQWVNREQRSASFVAPALGAGKSIVYRLQPLPAGTSAGAAACREQEGFIELLVGGKRVLRYHTAVESPPRGVNPVYRRSGYIHPVQTPGGRIVTSEFPADHLHQHGIFCAWVNTTFEGRKVDFWNQAGRTGNVEHVRTLGTRSGDVYAEFIVELRHSDLTAPGGAKPVLKELWTVRAWAIADAHLFDIESRQTCIADSALILNQYHYGGMAFRGTDQWFGGDKDSPAANKRIDFEILTSEGKGRVAGNGTRPRWVMAHGTVDEKPASLAAMGFPENFRHPEPVRLHPTKPYFVFTPPFLGEIRMEPGVEHVARYRFLVRDAGADAAAVERQYQHLANPPRVVVLTE